MSSRRKSTVLGVVERQECQREETEGRTGAVPSDRPRARAPRRHSLAVPPSILTNESSSDDENRLPKSPVESAAKRMRLLACDESNKEDGNEHYYEEGGDSEGEEMPHGQSSDEEGEEGDEDEDEEEPMIVENTTIESPESSDNHEEFEYEEEENIDVDVVNVAEDKKNIDGPSDIHERMRLFRELSHVLESNYEIKPMNEPPQLTRRCQGVGKACEVWSLMCYKDEEHSVKSNALLEGHDVSPEHRTTLVDWMMEVCYTEKLHRETFHLAIDYMDRFLVKSTQFNIKARPDNFQLIGTTAIFVAAKYEEIYPPKLEEVVSYTDEACTTSQVQQFEMIMLKALGWELNVVTALHWITLFLQLMGDKELDPRGKHTPPRALTSLDEHYAEGEPDEPPATVPTCRREEFVHLAQILDVAVLSEGCRQFTNRTLASAIMFNVYEPVSFVEQITGMSIRAPELVAAMEWVEPIALICEERRPLGDPLPYIENIRPDNVHNIQTMRSIDRMDEGVDHIMKMVCSLRKRRAEDRRRRSTHSVHTRGVAIRLRI